MFYCIVFVCMYLCLHVYAFVTVYVHMPARPGERGRSPGAKVVGICDLYTMNVGI